LFKICTKQATAALPLLKELCKDLEDQGISETLSPDDANMNYLLFTADDADVLKLVQGPEKVVTRYMGIKRVAHKDFTAKAMQIAERLQPGSTHFVPASFVLP
jgi:hypothetical protein